MSANEFRRRGTSFRRRRQADGPIIRWPHSGDGRWIVLGAMLVFCQYAAALAIGSAIGFIPHLPIVKYMIIALVISLLGGSIIASPKIWQFWREGEPHPVGRLVREADRAAVASYIVGFQLVSWQMGALTWLKDMLPAVIPYWADPGLASLERAILGTDAWRLVPEWLVRPFDVIYVTWALVHTITLIFILCLKPSPIKARAMIAYFLIVGVLGVCGQYLLSSAGPVFYDRIVGGAEFADLTARIVVHAPFVGLGVEMLWTSYSAHTDQIGNGISAMPSVHVATSAWIALALSSFRPKLRLPAWGYWLAIFIGSFALGWHYLLDAVVGTLGALGCWVLAGRLLSGETQEEEPHALAPVG
jgi:hypothetical protein